MNLVKIHACYVYIIHIVCKHFVGIANHDIYIKIYVFLGHFDLGVEFRTYQLEDN